MKTAGAYISSAAWHQRERRRQPRKLQLAAMECTRWAKAAAIGGGVKLIHQMAKNGLAYRGQSIIDAKWREICLAK